MSWEELSEPVEDAPLDKLEAPERELGARSPGLKRAPVERDERVEPCDVAAGVTRVGAASLALLVDDRLPAMLKACIESRSSAS